MDWARSLSFQPLRFIPVQSPYARLTCAVPYLATSASSAYVIDGCALSASISTASRATFPLSPAMNPKDICASESRRPAARLPRGARHDLDPGAHRVGQRREPAERRVHRLLRDRAAQLGGQGERLVGVLDADIGIPVRCLA